MFKLSCVAVLFFYLLLPALPSSAGIVPLVPGTDEHKFMFQDVDSYEDTTGELSFHTIATQAEFNPGILNYPQNTHTGSVYWFRIRVQYTRADDHQYLLEFYNQGIADLQVYVPGNNGRYTVFRTGAASDFTHRVFHHKNFEFWVPTSAAPVLRTYYFRVKTGQVSSIVAVHKTFNGFLAYALTEYLFFGVFYGIILVFCFYNLLMFRVIRESHYLYYTLYLLAVAFYQVSTDGLAYQYLWPHSPLWNSYAAGTFLYLVSVFALLFASELLQLKTRARQLYRLFAGLIVWRTLFFLLCVFYRPHWFSYGVIELVPLLTAFASGIYIRKKGYQPARFFVLAYAVLFMGFTAKLLVSLGFGWFIPGPLPYYSMSAGFLGEMIFFSFAIAEKVRLLKKNKEHAQQLIIVQMQENAKLKDELNSELEKKVQERTHTVMEKSVQLEEANYLLQLQAKEIDRMNSLLKADNAQLQENIKTVTRHRLLSAEVSFEEFSREYPDREACFKFLSELKWAAGYSCKKCGHQGYWAGNLPYSRKCSQCKYDESVIVGTVLQNTRILVNKALYIIFLVYSTKGKISSHKLSEIVEIRQNTCWMYSSKIKKLMIMRKKELEQAAEQGWSKLLME